MVCDSHAHDAPALMGQNHQDEQQATRRRSHDEEVRRRDLSDVSQRSAVASRNPRGRDRFST
jgi:hypothetical protein